MTKTSLVMHVLAVLFIAGCNPSESESNKKASTETKAGTLNPQVLLGDWIRTDGGYKLTIINATADGKLDASYFNPSPIHVGQAGWQDSNGKILVNIVLQDVNYPGSTYTLEFLPADGRLVGNYFQAMQKMNFNVEFIRQK